MSAENDLRPSRAAFLAATLVVLWALTAGGAVGAADRADAAPDADVLLRSGETFWEGQRLSFNATGIVSAPASASEANRTFAIRAVTDEGPGPLVTQFVVDERGRAVVDTHNLSGEYVVTHDGRTVHVRNGRGWFTTPNGAPATPDNSAWEVTEQSLAVRWTDATVAPGANRTLAITANRAGYEVAVSAGGLDFEALERLFPRAAYASDHDARAEDDTILLRVGADDRIVASFDEVDPGHYEFRVSATDTAAAGTASIAVQESDAELSFERDVIADEAGDVAAFTVRLRDTGRAFLVVGGPESNVLEVVRLTDDDGDGEVRVAVNTRYAGLRDGVPGVPADVRAYRSPDGTVERYGPDEGLPSGATLADLRTDLVIDPRGLDSPLEPASYDLALATTDDLTERNGRLDIRGVGDVATLSLTDPSLSGVTSGTAPTRGAGTQDRRDLKRAFSVTDSIAMGDRLVVRIQASGVFGYLAGAGGTSPGVLRSEEEGYNLSVLEELPDSNATRRVGIDLSGPGVALSPDGPANRLYLVIDTRAVEADRELEAGTNYTVRVTHAGVDDDRPVYDVTADNASGYTGFPYLPPGNESSVNASFSLVAPGVGFQELDGANDTLTLREEANVTVDGRTNLAPGTHLMVQLRSREQPAFIKRRTVPVRSNRRFAATFNMSDAERGQNFTVSIGPPDRTLLTIDGRVVEGAATVEETPTPTPTPTANLITADESTTTAPLGESTAQGSPPGSVVATKTAAGDGGSPTRSAPTPTASPTASTAAATETTATPTAGPTSTDTGTETPGGSSGPIDMLTAGLGLLWPWGAVGLVAVVGLGAAGVYVARARRRAIERAERIREAESDAGAELETDSS